MSIGRVRGLSGDAELEVELRSSETAMHDVHSVGRWAWQGQKRGYLYCKKKRGLRKKSYNTFLQYEMAQDCGFEWGIVRK